MFRQRARRFLFLLNPLAASSGAILGVYLKVSNDKTIWVVGAFIAVLLLCSLVTAYYTHIRPLKDSNVIGHLFLDMVGNNIQAYCSGKGVEVRLNVLMIYRPVKFLFLIRRFRVRWHLGMAHDGDGAAEFGIKKGVVGRVFKSGNKVAVNTEGSKPSDWGFSARDLKRLKLPDHKMIWSFPVNGLDKMDMPTGTILGMVNLDSLQQGAYAKLVADPVVRAELENMLQDFQDIVMKIASC
jgi:hypothetical protein